MPPACRHPASSEGTLRHTGSRANALVPSDTASWLLPGAAAARRQRMCVNATHRRSQRATTSDQSTTLPQRARRVYHARRDPSAEGGSAGVHPVAILLRVARLRPYSGIVNATHRRSQRATTSDQSTTLPQRARRVYHARRDPSAEGGSAGVHPVAILLRVARLRPYSGIVNATHRRSQRATTSGTSTTQS